MESKILGIPFVAIVFVLLTSFFVAVLVIAYLSVFVTPVQMRELNRIDQEVQVLLIPTVTPTPTVAPLPTPTTGVFKAPVRTVVPATTSAK